MARPQNQIAAPTLRLKDGTWRIRWRDTTGRYEFSTGYRESQREEAEGARLQAALALRGVAEWPEWADSIPVVQRWREKSAQKAPENSPDGQAALMAWENYYAASVSPEHAKTRCKEVAALAAQHNLLTLSHDDAVNFFRSLSEAAPRRYLSEHIAQLMGG